MMKPHITYHKKAKKWICKVTNHHISGRGITPLDSYSGWLVEMACANIDPWERDKK